MLLLKRVIQFHYYQCLLVIEDASQISAFPMQQKAKQKGNHHCHSCRNDGDVLGVLVAVVMHEKRMEMKCLDGWQTGHRLVLPNMPCCGQTPKNFSSDYWHDLDNGLLLQLRILIFYGMIHYRIKWKLEDHSIKFYNNERSFTYTAYIQVYNKVRLI